MRHGSLFSGGGGFDLAAEMVGWKNIFHCEKDDFCLAVLQYYWPESETIEDIKEFDGRKYAGTIDVISGGFPCQPFSIAGKRKGTDDDRYLWPEMLRVIRQVKPPWIVGENVLGLINWNDGLVFEQVQLDLEAEGYEVSTFVLPAAGINAPHQRYRVWIVAYNAQYDTKRPQKNHSDTGSVRRTIANSCREAAQRRKRRERKQSRCLCEIQLEEAGSNPYLLRRNRGKCTNEKFSGKGGKYAQRHACKMGAYAANPYSKRSKSKVKIRKLEWNGPGIAGSGTDWRNWPTQSPLCGGDDGISYQLDGIAFPKWRRKSIKLFGNAIVPQIAKRIFEAINEFERR